MATGTFPGGIASGTVAGNTTQATFIPEIWSDEVIAAYKSNLKMGPLVRKMPMVGKKGDTIHIPKPVRGSAAAKAEATAVTIQANTATELQIAIDQHWEYSTMIEDITEKQALSSMRRFYTDDAGYALAKQVDDTLFAMGTGFGNGVISKTGTVVDTATADWVHSNSLYNDASTGLTAFADATVVAADVFTDAAMRGLVQRLDDEDVPMDNRYFVVCPSMKKQLLGIDRYVSTDFVNGKPVTSGYVGNVYGVDIYVSTNVPTIDATVRGNLLFHKDAIVFAEQMGVRTQTQYKQEFLADLFTADTLFGTQVYRPEAGLVFASSDA